MGKRGNGERKTSGSFVIENNDIAGGCRLSVRNKTSNIICAIPL